MFSVYCIHINQKGGSGMEKEKKTPNQNVDAFNTNQSFIFSENGLVIHSDERSIKVESSSVELVEKR